ncbi:hypothetical protein BDW69DRAFT_190546 [Aspergillus filifer]
MNGIEESINTAANNIDALDPFPTEGAMTLDSPFNDMEIGYTELIDVLTNNESTLREDGLAGSVLRSLQKQVAAFGNLEEALAAKVPDIVQSAVHGWVGGVVDLLERTITAYSG